MLNDILASAKANYVQYIPNVIKLGSHDDYISNDAMGVISLTAALNGMGKH